MAYRKSEKGAAIRRWLKEEWTDQHGRECGGSETKGVKKCRPKNKISSKTPKTWKEVGSKKDSLVAENVELEWVIKQVKQKMVVSRVLQIREYVFQE